MRRHNSNFPEIKSNTKSILIIGLLILILQFTAHLTVWANHPIGRLTTADSLKVQLAQQLNDHGLLGSRKLCSLLFYSLL